MPFGWEPLAFSEIGLFPCSVLAERFPEIPNLGDISKIDWGSYAGTVDIVVGGSPCQSFSIQGNREGLAGKSGLMFEYLRAVRDIAPRWVLWENVPGCLSSDEGRAFATLVNELCELGYGIEWRVLDSQRFGCPTRRRRVFVVGHLGSLPPGMVLFELHGLQEAPERCEAIREENPPHRGEVSSWGIGTHFGLTGITRELLPTFDTKAQVYVLKEDGEHLVDLRKLSPTEAERAMGFPEGWTEIPGASTTARFFALGNSMAVPVIRWIGRRIARSDALITRIAKVP